MRITPEARTVEIIRPTINPSTHLPIITQRKRRVAGYARVSTDSDEQYTSYETQIKYYSTYIRSNPDWEYVDVYTDEGISGLNTKNRDGFNNMIRDAKAGKIDLIITKSVSRFARNTVDTLSTIRTLKDIGCECYFEKENIWTFDGKGELMLTIMSSIAQEESRSISENVVWGQRKRFADGKVSLAYKNFLGYRKGPDKDNPLIVVEEEAAIIRRIYTDFISGKTASTIAKVLMDDNIPSPAGKPVWRASTVNSILQNEKYKGSALLQKGFTVNYLTKKTKKNEGEVPQYYIEHSHDAIISPDEWELVQTELHRRKEIGRQYSGNSVFGSRLICEDCGGFYGKKTWNSTNKYRREIWQCNSKFKNEKKCTTPHLDEEDIKQRFLTVFNSLFPHREQLLEDCQLAITRITDTTVIEEKISSLTAELAIEEEIIRQIVDRMASAGSESEDIEVQYREHEKRYNLACEKIEKLQQKKVELLHKADDIRIFMHALEKRENPVDKFDDLLWLSVIDKVLVGHNGMLTFCFRNGMKAFK